MNTKPQPSTVLSVLAAGTTYFALVFGAGFILGSVRILLLVPRFGTRLAELMELPLMLVVTILAASWVVRRFRLPRAIGPRLCTGLIGLSLLVISEIALVLTLRGMTIGEYFRTRDPVAGAVYYTSLLLLVLMPSLVSTGEVVQTRKTET